MKTSISYGKIGTTFQRTYAQRLSGVAPIPESEFSGKSNIVFAYTVGVEVFGNNFLPAYTEGDNRMLVATDTMKNFILREAAMFEGSTLEGLLYFLGAKFLATYPVMESLEISGREFPFQSVRVPSESGFVESEVLFNHVEQDVSAAVIRLERDPSGADGVKVVSHRCSREGFRLLKVTGSSFAAFMRDDYTTLPEYTDRPLFVYMDLGWTYSSSEGLLAQGEGYAPGEQISDVCKAMFHDLNSRSIQELIFVMGGRILERFPQLQTVSFDSENHTWDRVTVHPDNDKIRVYWEPKKAYGQLRLTLERE